MFFMCFVWHAQNVQNGHEKCAMQNRSVNFFPPAEHNRLIGNSIYPEWVL